MSIHLARPFFLFTARKPPVLTSKLYYLLLLVWFGACTASENTKFTPTPNPIGHRYNFYKKAELFNYSVKYGFLGMGTVQIACSDSLLVVGNKPCYHIRANAKLHGTAGFFTNFDDTWESHVDTASLLPVRFSRNLIENRYRKRDHFDFDYTLSTVNVTDLTTPDKTKQAQYPITPQIQDMVSAYYLLRNVPFGTMAKGDSAVIDIFLDDRSYNFKIRYQGIEQVKVAGKGLIKAYRITPIDPQYKATVWISTDANRILHKIVAELAFGSVQMDLRQYQVRNEP